MLKLKPLWLQIISTHDHIQRALNLFLEMYLTNASPLIVCDTMKVYLRGLLIKEISLAKTKSRQEVQDSTPENCSLWVEAQSQLKLLMEKRAQNKQFFNRHLVWAEGEKVGKLLTAIARNF